LLWIVDPGTRVFEVWRLDGGAYRLVLAAADGDKVSRRGVRRDRFVSSLSVLWAR
jgi:hypothetical protein